MSFQLVGSPTNVYQDPNNADQANQLASGELSQRGVASRATDNALIADREERTDGIFQRMRRNPGETLGATASATLFTAAGLVIAREFAFSSLRDSASENSVAATVSGVAIGTFFLALSAAITYIVTNVCILPDRN